MVSSPASRSREQSSPQNTPEERCLALIKSRPLVKERIEARGTYTINAITNLIAHSPDGGKKDDPRVLAIVEYVVQQLEGEGLKIGPAIGRPIASDADRLERYHEYARRSGEADKRRKAALKQEVVEPAPEASTDDLVDDVHDASEDNDYVDDLGDDDVDFAELGFSPAAPTKAKPGSEEKVLALAARYQAGMPFWNADDAQDLGSQNPDADRDERVERFTRSAQAQREYLASLSPHAS